MHDIICPSCGERFLGYDVAFDLSKYIVPLLVYDKDEEDEIRKVKFKFLADEDTIVRSVKNMDMARLECNNPGGPGGNDEVFEFKVTCAILLKYILEKTGLNEKDMSELVKYLDPHIKSGKFDDIPLSIEEQLKNFCQIFFDIKQSNFDIGDARVQVALHILTHIHKNKDNLAHSLELKVAVYSYKLNKAKNYRVPDILFVRQNGSYDAIRKCCRFCGRELPLEFGYYKMKPVVLLGSHASGKTSFLLSLLYTATLQEPFCSNDNIRAVSLQDDPEYTAFHKNIGNYRDGFAPNKTDFSNVPILNLKVKDTIYSFIDWPGEKFISGLRDSSGAGADHDYIYKSRRVIIRAHHVLFFLPPEQVSNKIQAEDENVRFDLLDLKNSLTWHLNYPDKRYFKSIAFIVNKADKLTDKANGLTTAASLADVLDKYIDSSVFDNKWHADAMKKIEDATKEFIHDENVQLSGILDAATFNNDTLKKIFIPVSPYGHAAEMRPDGENGRQINASKTIRRGLFTGLPFLHILKTDGIID